MKYYPKLLGCSIAVTLIFAIFGVYGGFKILDAYSLYFGAVWSGEEWTRATMPIYLFIVEEMLSGIVPISLFFIFFSRNNRLIISSTALMKIVMVIQFISWVFTRTNPTTGSLNSVMVNSLETYYSQIEPKSSHNISVQFWDNFQTNLECCGIYGPSDWANASGAPTVGFIPNSCCRESTDSCTKATTKQNLNDFSDIIYTKGCLTRFSSDYDIQRLWNWAVLLVYFQLLIMSTARCYIKSGLADYLDLDNLDNDNNGVADAPE